jgi:hypothetical protein
VKFPIGGNSFKRLARERKLTWCDSRADSIVWMVEGCFFMLLYFIYFPEDYVREILFLQGGFFK